MTAGLYVYGIVTPDAEAPEGLVGVHDRPLELIVVDDLALLVSELDSEAMGEGELGEPEDLLAHTTVLDAVAAGEPVLPLAFGTVALDDDDALRVLQGPGAANFSAELERLRGVLQYTLLVRFDRDVILREILDEQPEALRLRERIAGTGEMETRNERIRLGELVVDAMAHKRSGEAASMVEQLEPVVTDLSERDLRQPDDVLDVAVLVRHDAVDDFDAAVDRIAEARHERMTFRLLGPQAPYDFVEAR